MVVVVLLCSSPRQQGLLPAALNTCRPGTDEEEEHMLSQQQTSSATHRSPKEGRRDRILEQHSQIFLGKV